MSEPYPGYDVLDKQDTPSWNEQTRRVIEARLALGERPRFFTEAEFAAVRAIAARLVPPRADGRAAVPVEALVDHKLHTGQGDGYREAGMPREQEAWRRGLAALEAEAEAAHAAGFVALTAEQQDGLLRRMEEGALDGPAWGGMPSKTFFKKRLGRDVVMAYYAHPSAWSRIGFGGPASPRGYVRMGWGERDGWEAVEAKRGEAKPGEEGRALRENRDVG